jgi:Ser/Thr protein kinase RdoA (MazF antagonist)
LTRARPGTPEGIDPEQGAQIRARLPELAASCAELSACGVPASLQHDDLHDGNVFAGGGRVFDWGDAYLGMPFAVLLVVQSSVAARLSTGGDDPRITRLRRAYLEPWTDRHPAAELDRLALLAVQAAVVGRAVGWLRALGGASPEDLGTWGSAPAEWLGALLEPPPW